LTSFRPPCRGVSPYALVILPSRPPGRIDIRPCRPPVASASRRGGPVCPPGILRFRPVIQQLPHRLIALLLLKSTFLYINLIPSLLLSPLRERIEVRGTAKAGSILVPWNHASVSCPRHIPLGLDIPFFILTVVHSLQTVPVLLLILLPYPIPLLAKSRVLPLSPF